MTINISREQTRKLAKIISVSHSSHSDSCYERLSHLMDCNPLFPLTTPSASLKQGTWLTRPDPWPQIEGTRYWEQELASSTTLCHLY